MADAGLMQIEWSEEEVLKLAGVGTGAEVEVVESVGRRIDLGCKQRIQGAVNDKIGIEPSGWENRSLSALPTNRSNGHAERFYMPPDISGNAGLAMQRETAHPSAAMIHSRDLLRKHFTVHALRGSSC